MRVRTDHVDYKALRNFAGLPFEEATVRVRRDAMSVVYRALERTTGRRYRFLKYAHLDLWPGREDLLHLFGTVSLNRSPWVATFSHPLPDWGGAMRTAGLRRLAAAPCRRLIAISDYSARRQLDYAQRHAPELAAEISDKLDVIHPAQPLLLPSMDQKAPPDGQVAFVFAGAHFFRKGGVEVLRAFDRLLRAGADVALHLATRLPDHTSEKVSEACLRECHAIIERWDAIAWHGVVANEQVLRLLARSHVALLPTYLDLYGYFVLEAQASGCPVLTTDIEAMPEINDDRRGWVIPVEKDALGRAVDRFQYGTGPTSERIEAALFETVSGILEDPTVLQRKGARCLEAIAERHDPVAAARRLEALYRRAVADPHAA